ncbi:MAG: hypothetical protein LC777_02190 [Actinobacteria bacterium]|nr:hypothetical protein [Actinomycetota bacterium]
MTIVKTNERADSEPFEVVVVRPKGLASRVFTLTRVGEQLTIVDDIPRSRATPEREGPIRSSRLTEALPAVAAPPEEPIVFEAPPFLGVGRDV